MPLLTRKLTHARRMELMPTGSLPMARIQHARPLRIALVTEYYYPHLGGICEHVHFFAREARRYGHQVDIITSKIPGARPEPHVVRIGKSQPVYANGSQARFTWGLELRKDLKRVFSLGQYDIIHVHSPLSPVLPVMAIEEANCPVVGTFHTYFDRSFFYSVGNRYFQKRLDMLDAAIAVSHSTTIALNRYFEANWTIIPNGIDTDVFNPHVPRPPALRSDVPVILFLGRFDPRNGLTTLIESFKKVRGNGEVTPFLCALGLFALSYAGLGISLWPMIVPPHVTIWDALLQGKRSDIPKLAGRQQHAPPAPPARAPQSWSDYYARLLSPRRILSAVGRTRLLQPLRRKLRR